MTLHPLPPPAPDAASPQPPEVDALAVAKARAALSRRDAAVLRELTLLADRNGQAAPSQTELAAAVRMSERSVRDAVKSLEGLGWIERQAVSAGKGGRANDRYTVHAAPAVRS